MRTTDSAILAISFSGKTPREMITIMLEKEEISINMAINLAKYYKISMEIAPKQQTYLKDILSEKTGLRQ